MTFCCTFIPDSHAIDLLCRLFAAYKHGAVPNELLTKLRDRLGQQEFENFESDLTRLMRTRPAWKAVASIIEAALVRKKQARPGVADRRIDRRGRTLQEL